MPKGQFKHCSFMCGFSTHSADPVDPARLMRWVCESREPTPRSPNEPRGGNCWYCERAWTTHIVHGTGGRSREQFKEAMGLDQAVMAQQREARAKVLEKAQKCAASGQPAGSYKRVSVREQSFKETALVKPSDDFWEISRYRARFGSPSRAANKKLGHVKCRVGDHMGVIVPGDDGKGPWKLENRSGSRLELDKAEDVGSASDDEEAAEKKFADLAAQRKKEYREAAAGAMRDVLAACVLDEKGQEEEARRRAATRKKRASRKAKATREERRPAFGQRGFLALADSQDETESAEETPAKRLKQGRSPATAKAAASDQPKIKDSAVGLAMGGATGADSVQNAAMAPGQGEGGEAGDEANRKRGKPALDSRQQANQMWAEFDGLGPEQPGIFFGPRSDVQRRMLARWIAKASDKACTVSDQEKASYELARKRMQLMDQCIAMHRRWTNRCDNRQGIAEFEQSWNLMATFAEAAPTVQMRCKFVWNWHMQIKIQRCCEPEVSMAEDLKASVLGPRFGLGPEMASGQSAAPGQSTASGQSAASGQLSVSALQRTYIEQWLVSCLMRACSPQACKDAMARLCRPLMTVSDQLPAVSDQLAQELASVMLVVAPPALSFDPEEGRRIRAAKALVAEAPAAAAHLCHCFFKFPAMGKKLVDDFHQAVASFEKAWAWAEDVRTGATALKRHAETIKAAASSGQPIATGSGQVDANIAASGQLRSALALVREPAEAYDSSEADAWRPLFAEMQPAICEAFQKAEEEVLLALAGVAASAWAELMGAIMSPASGSLAASGQGLVADFSCFKQLCQRHPMSGLLASAERYEAWARLHADPALIPALVNGTVSSEHEPAAAVKINELADLLEDLSKDPTASGQHCQITSWCARILPAIQQQQEGQYREPLVQLEKAQATCKEFAESISLACAAPGQVQEGSAIVAALSDTSRESLAKEAPCLEMQVATNMLGHTVLISGFATINATAGF